MHPTSTKTYFLVWYVYCVLHECIYMRVPFLNQKPKLWSIFCRISCLSLIMDITVPNALWLNLKFEFLYFVCNFFDFFGFFSIFWLKNQKKNRKNHKKKTKFKLQIELHGAKNVHLKLYTGYSTENGPWFLILIQTWAVHVHAPM